MKKRINTYLLMMNANDHNLSWGFIPDDLWKNILQWSTQYTSLIGFEGVDDKLSANDIECLSNIDALVNKRCRLTYSWKNKLGKKLEHSYDLALFEYNVEIQKAIKQVEFNQWSKVYEENPIDNLFFFQEDRLLMDVTPYENMITFHINDQQLPTLQKLDKRIAHNLHDPKPNKTLFLAF